jgi:hypothetical protein
MSPPGNSAQDRYCYDARTGLKLHQLESEPQDGTVTRRFFPLDRLRKFFTREKVTQILQCSCKKCDQFKDSFGRGVDPLTSIDGIVGVRPEDKQNPAKSAFALFGLLIYIEFPLLIIEFVQGGHCDEELERWPEHFSQTSLRDICPIFSKFNDGDIEPELSSEGLFMLFSSQFVEHMPRFGLPRMDSGFFSKYKANRTLPFVNEEKLGIRNERGDVESEGQNGTVYSFEIYPEYLKFWVCLASKKIHAFH